MGVLMAHSRAKVEVADCLKLSRFAYHPYVLSICVASNKTSKIYEMEASTNTRPGCSDQWYTLMIDSLDSTIVVRDTICVKLRTLPNLRQ